MRLAARLERAAACASALACIALLACNSREISGAGAAPPGAAAASPTPGRATECDARVLAAAQFGTVLKAPITESIPVAGDAQACLFTTAGFAAVTLSVRPALGRAGIATWRSGKMSLSVSNVDGVGDEAVWQETLRVLIARKGEVLCDIQVRAGAEDLIAEDAALARRLGVVCDRVFAAR